MYAGIEDTRGRAVFAFASKCCIKCRRRREKKLLKKLANFRRFDEKQSKSSSRTSSRERRSPSVRLDPNRKSPSFLERRRITSARKPPIPYNRKWTDDSGSDSDDSFYGR